MNEGTKAFDDWILHMRRGDFEAAWNISDRVLRARAPEFRASTCRGAFNIFGMASRSTEKGYWSVVITVSETRYSSSATLHSYARVRVKS